MHDRLHRPTAGKSSGGFLRTKDSKASSSSDGLPAGLRLLDDPQSSIGLSEILAALTAEPAAPDMRIREVEDSIRRHWAVLRNLVREHAELTRAATKQSEAMAGLHGDHPLPKVALFTPPMRQAMAAE